MPTRREIVAAAAAHADADAGTTAQDAYAHAMRGYEADVVWAAWVDDAAPDGVGLRVVKGWDRAGDATVAWSAVKVDDADQALEVQENLGDGARSLGREPWPLGALVD